MVQSGSVLKAAMLDTGTVVRETKQRPSGGEREREQFLFVAGVFPSDDFSFETALFKTLLAGASLATLLCTIRKIKIERLGCYVVSVFICACILFPLPLTLDDSSNFSYTCLQRYSYGFVGQEYK